VWSMSSSNPIDKCGPTNCHGVDLSCGSEPVDMCDMSYMIGDGCRQWASCQVESGRCQMVVEPGYEACVSCVSKCEEEYLLDDIGLSECESGCMTSEVEEKTGPLEVEIVGPEGEVFEKSQARMWKAEIRNVSSSTGLRAVCNWRFYLNENNDEVLYREQETKTIVSKNKDNWCGFTSTFIEKRGVLRAEVTVSLMEVMQDTILESLVAERDYLVK
jgi:hypothetical protein